MRSRQPFSHALLPAACLALLYSAWGAQAQIRQLNLVLPTPNRAIFGSDPSQYYMYTHRSFEGRQSTPWQAGKYGYVRNPKRSTVAGIAFTKFHEGIDIRPTGRDRSSNPTDIVRSIGAGEVAYANSAPGGSNYGRYIVVRHDWGYGKFYSLYAHLASVTCRAGQTVRPGTAIGKMGYSGSGLNRSRAHLHLELNMMVSSRFATWHDSNFRSPNPHGNHNGLNLAGLDIAGLYLAHQRDPDITLPRFMSRMKVYWKAVVPNKGKPDILKFYPWLARDMAKATSNPSWEISFSSSGIPLSVRPSERGVRSPMLSWVTSSDVPHSWNTRSRLSGSGKSATITSSGLRYIQLLVGDF